MSLINQVLSDLEKRGAGIPAPVAASIRPVPAQPQWMKVARLIAGAAALTAILGVALWAALGRDSVSALTVPATQPAPGPAVPHRAEQPHLPDAINTAARAASEVPGTPASGTPAAHLALELAAIPIPSSLNNDLPIVHREDATAKHVRRERSTVKNAATKSAPAAEMAIQDGVPIKRVSAQQQAEAEYNQAAVLIQQGRKDTAQQHLETALQLNPAHAQARQALVGLLLENKRNADVERVLRDGLRIDPGKLDLAVLLARLQVERNALPEALETLQKVQPYAGEQGNYHAFLAAVLQRLNRHEEAVAHYKTALRQSPNSGVWLMGMGISLQALKHNEEARDAFRHAMESHSLSAELQDFVGRRIKEL